MYGLIYMNYFSCIYTELIDNKAFYRKEPQSFRKESQRILDIYLKLIT